MAVPAAAEDDFGLIWEPYSSRVLQLYRLRKNAGVISSPDGVGLATAPRIYVRITIAVVGDRIVDARFQCPTCLVAVAASSLLTEWVQRVTLDEAMRLTPEALAAWLGGIPEDRMDRCQLAVQALQEAVREYRARQSSLAKGVQT